MEIRTLTREELVWAKKAKCFRTLSEVKAYLYLPDCMKSCVVRNPVIAFKNSRYAYYPDLFFEKERICVEIDGPYHRYRHLKDNHRDKVFELNGVTTIRIMNQDLSVEVSFWQRLVEGMKKIKNPVENVLIFIRELETMIDKEIKSWTKLDYYE